MPKGHDTDWIGRAPQPDLTADEIAALQVRVRAAEREVWLLARERHVNRAYMQGLIWALAGFTMLVGLLLWAGGEQRLTSPFFKGPAAIIPGWPGTWALLIGTTGALVFAGWWFQTWWVGITGCAGITMWAWGFAVLSWTSMTDKDVGSKVAW
jgi:hypothetical protein